MQAALGESYVIEDELGGGGMGRVFSARETALGRRVAVKVLAPELGAGVDLDRFRREIQVIARLQHPHVVPLFTSGEARGLVFYTMPLVRGDTLRIVMERDGRMEIADAVRLLRDVTEALACAHREGIVHRDVKPENVLVVDGHGVVTDFGVAKAVSAASSESLRTSIGFAIGTPTYMSPEQVSADPSIDHRADLYSLGVLGYEMLAGHPPFYNRPPQRIMAAQVTEAPPDILGIRPELSPGLAGLIMRCLEKDPSRRPQSAEEVLRVLVRHSVQTPSGMPRVALRRAFAGQRWLWYVATAIVVVGSILLAKLTTQ